MPEIAAGDLVLLGMLWLENETIVGDLATQVENRTIPLVLVWLLPILPVPVPDLGLETLVVSPAIRLAFITATLVLVVTLVESGHHVSIDAPMPTDIAWREAVAACPDERQLAVHDQLSSVLGRQLCLKSNKREHGCERNAAAYVEYRWARQQTIPSGLHQISSPARSDKRHMILIVFSVAGLCAGIRLAPGTPLSG